MTGNAFSSSLFFEMDKLRNTRVSNEKLSYKYYKVVLDDNVDSYICTSLFEDETVSSSILLAFDSILRTKFTNKNYSYYTDILHCNIDSCDYTPPGTCLISSERAEAEVVKVQCMLKKSTINQMLEILHPLSHFSPKVTQRLLESIPSKGI